MMETSDDLRMMNSPSDWPIYPALPVKRSREGTAFPETGVILAIDALKQDLGVQDSPLWSDMRFTVYIDADLDKLGQVVKEILTDKFPNKIVYKSYEDMLTDGWMVD